MTDTATDGSDSTAITQAIIELLTQPTDPDLAEAQALMARRIATSAAITPSRIPAPGSITVVGGYLNLLERAGEDVLRLQAIAGALGLAGPLDLRYQTAGPALFFTTRSNLRVTAEAQQAAPTHIEIRSDFALAWDAMASVLAARGLELPVLRTSVPLPDFGQPVPTDLLEVVGRSLTLVPGLALTDPATDTFVIVENADGDPEVHLRQVTTDTPDAGSVAEVTVSAQTCDASSCSLSDVTLHLEHLGPHMAAAGWFPTALAAPTSLGDDGGYTRWRNVTGLVAGETTLGDELGRLYAPDRVAASALRDHLAWRWDGTTFAAV